MISHEIVEIACIGWEQDFTTEIWNEKWFSEMLEIAFGCEFQISKFEQITLSDHSALKEKRDVSLLHWKSQSILQQPLQKLFLTEKSLFCQEYLMVISRLFVNSVWMIDETWLKPIWSKSSIC